MASSTTEPDDSFYEELNADFSGSLGELKTDNPDDDRFQRQWVHLSPDKSEFKKTVETVLCVHGRKSKTDPTPMTLVVFGVELNCHARDFRFQSVRIWVGFHEDEKADPPNSTPVKPAVVAYAPWVQQRRWNASDATITNTKGVGSTVGAEQVAKVELSGNLERQIEFTRLHFDRGTASRRVDPRSGRIFGVEWYCEQNDLQKHGVEPYFLVGILVQRATGDADKPTTFSATFDMRIEAGFLHDMRQGFRRAFRLRRPEDAPIYFDPSRPPAPHGLQDKGLSLLSDIDPENLGGLAVKDHLSKLLEPKEGMKLAAFKPMDPPKPPDE
ncbi:hypothetical protein CC80DRAFT_488627 [Byssothecium circinans]|uniref:Uncharacterized protein n=1 Tax=Byssothecium circinans TaxID=147558 RepID=A0A6A5UEK4_9PLEO|nr:hypothetical protein CC80DRAFT_488627 [Byssothecium circinans]